MNQTHWTKARILNGVLALAVMLIIFLFSAGSGEESSGISRGVTEWLIRLIYPKYDVLNTQKQSGAFLMLHIIVRKCAHFGEFALLGAALRQFLWTFPIRYPGLWAWLAATGYAALDEWHQTFVSGRSGQVQDVCIDSAGALFGVFLAAAIAALIAARLRKKD